jgi:hypothetical protein
MYGPIPILYFTSVNSFKAKIEIIGINPFVFLPDRILKNLFTQAGKDKGPIPVRGTIDGHAYIQTLVKYSGYWRLYINGPMLKDAKKHVGDIITLTIEFDLEERVIPMHPKLMEAIDKNRKAKKVFDQLSASRQKEIIRYINSLKSESSVSKNITRAINFLCGKESFVGRAKP